MTARHRRQALIWVTVLLYICRVCQSGWFRVGYTGFTHLFAIPKTAKKEAHAKDKKQI